MLDLRRLKELNAAGRQVLVPVQLDGADLVAQPADADEAIAVDGMEEEEVFVEEFCGWGWERSGAAWRRSGVRRQRVGAWGRPYTPSATTNAGIDSAQTSTATAIRSASLSARRAAVGTIAGTGAARQSLPPWVQAAGRGATGTLVDRGAPLRCARRQRRLVGTAFSGGQRRGSTNPPWQSCIFLARTLSFHVLKDFHRRYLVKNGSAATRL